MRAIINIPIEASGRMIETALEGYAQLATAEHQAAGGMPLLYQSGIRYQRERGTENWLLPSESLIAGVADCEDLAAYRVAELRSTGVDPLARIVVVKTGPRTLHAVVRRGDGTIEDPSRALGMRGAGEGVALPRLLAGVERGHSWVEASRRTDRGPIISAPTLSEALAVESVAGAELGFVGTLLRAAGGAVNAVVPGLLNQNGAAARSTAPAAAPRATAPAIAIRAPAQYLAANPAVAMQARGVAQDSGMGPEDVLRIAAQLARVIGQEKRRNPVRVQAKW